MIHSGFSHWVQKQLPQLLKRCLRILKPCKCDFLQSLRQLLKTYGISDVNDILFLLYRGRNGFVDIRSLTVYLPVHRIAHFLQDTHIFQLH